MDENQSQLAWERKFGRPAAAAAIISLILGVAAQVVASAAATQEGGAREDLQKLDANAGSALAGTILYCLSVALLALVLLYLLRCVRHRREEASRFAVAPLIVVAPLLIAIGSVLLQLDVAGVASDFVEGGPQSERRADRLLEDRSPVPVFMGFAGNIALGFGFIVTCLNAMRAGLLTRFMGILGIIVGALYVLPVPGVGSIIQIFWLGALAAIFANLWPGGRGEAWETGRPGVWLSAAEQRRQEMRDNAARNQDVDNDEALQGSRLPEPDDPPAPRKRRKKRK